MIINSLKKLLLSRVSRWWLGVIRRANFGLKITKINNHQPKRAAASGKRGAYGLKRKQNFQPQFHNKTALRQTASRLIREYDKVKKFITYLGLIFFLNFEVSY